MKPLAIDLFCGLGGWAEGFIAEGYDVIGFDLERHDYGTGGYLGQLVLQDVQTLDGKQFKDAAVIVASPPCQKYSYMAMPWSRGKAMAAEIRQSYQKWSELNFLFAECFRIAWEAGVPLIVENVRGAQEWVGPARWAYGSFYLWGDVPALMPINGKWKALEMNWSDRTKRGQDFTRCAAGGGYKGVPHRPSGHWANPEENGLKQGGDWFNAEQPSISRLCSSKSSARKAASAHIAKIPFPLARHIARCFKPQ